MMDKRFEEHEVAQILGRALALQTAPTAEEASNTTTLSQIKQIASEVGIAPVLVDEAVTFLEGKRRVVASLNSTTVLIEQTLPGECTPEVWERMVTEARLATGRVGTIQSRGEQMEWTDGSDLETVVVTATHRKNRTTISLIGDSSGTAAMMVTISVVLTIFAMLVPIIIAAKSGGAVPWMVSGGFSPAILGMSVLLTMLRVRRLRRGFALRLEKLMGEFERILGVPRP
jgi:hypothetical protein